MTKRELTFASFWMDREWSFQQMVEAFCDFDVNSRVSHRDLDSFDEQSVSVLFRVRFFSFLLKNAPPLHCCVVSQHLFFPFIFDRIVELHVFQKRVDAFFCSQ